MKFALSLAAAAARTFVIPAQAENVTANMAKAADALIASLDAKQKAQAVFKFDGEERTYWHFIPAEMLKGGGRKGLQIEHMTGQQRELTHALLKTVLSESGHTKVKNIMFLEDILYMLEGKNRRFVRDRDAYHILVFGKPGNKGAWGWRFEGHHLSLNYTIVNGKLSVVPSFLASNPAVADFGPGRKLIALEAEEFAARALRTSLTSAQAKQAVIAEKAPRDILTSALLVGFVGRHELLALGRNLLELKLQFVVFIFEGNEGGGIIN